MVAQQMAEDGRLANAFRLYREALAMRPGLAEAHDAVSRIYDQTGHADWAGVERERSRAAGPPDCGSPSLHCDFREGRLDAVVAATEQGVRRLGPGRAQRDAHRLRDAVGVADNRDGIGARVGVVREGVPRLWGRAHTDGSYLTASDPRVHFGLGTAPARAVIVEWPRGARETWPVADAGRLLTLTQGTGHPITASDRDESVCQPTPSVLQSQKSPMHNGERRPPRCGGTAAPSWR